MDASIDTLFDTYLKAPSAETYAPLREAVISRPGYDPYGRHAMQARQLLDKGDAGAALAYLSAHIHDLLLHPGAHLLLAMALDRIGKKDAARAAVAWAGLLMRPILASGDGSRGCPYVVSYIADEYELLRYLGKAPGVQSLHQGPGAVCDVHTCEDGSEIWFDITTPFGHMMRAQARARPGRPGGEEA